MKKLFGVFLLAFALNWLWENGHAFLYFHPSGAAMTETMLVWAAFFDALFVTLLALLFLKINYLRRRLWLALVFGVVAGMAGEWYALRAGLWAYRAAMPLLPIVKIGLSPSIQLAVIAYLVFKVLKLSK